MLPHLNIVRSLLFIIFTVSCNAYAASEKPNVVFIMVDNWGWGDLSVQGSTIATPRIDQLANEGLRLTNYNVESQCMPTRAAIHSARLPIRSGTAKNDWSASTEGLAPWEYTIAELFHDAGYATAMFGKWHLGASAGRYPTDQGYDEWFGVVRSTNEASYTESHGFDPETLTVFNESPAILEGLRGRAPTRALAYDMQSRGSIDEMLFDRSIAYLNKRDKDKKPFFFNGHDNCGSPSIGTQPSIQRKVWSG